jgi:DNA-binding beta-propeller fold protein YncE
MQWKILMAAMIAAVAFAGAARAAELKKVGEIAVEGDKLGSFDISFVDQKNQRYYLADRTNKGVDVFDAKTDKYIGRVGGMVGPVMKGDKVDNDSSGPNGVVIAGDEAWVGDGQGMLRVVDVKSMKITDTITTGGKMRADELDYDAKDGIIAIALDADDPPTLVLVSTKPGHKIIGKVPFPDATDGLEQTGYNPADGMFYSAVPELKKDPTKGGVAVISTDAKLVKIMPVDNCNPHGFVVLPGDKALLGCSAHGKDGMPPVTMIFDLKSGKVVATVADLGGTDEAAYSKKNGQYYTGSSNQPGGHVLGVIDASTNKLVQKIAITGGTPHSVAVNETNGHVYLPVGSADGGCGCIQVFAPAM